MQLRTKSALIALAVAASASLAACSGGRSMLPGIAPQSLDAMRSGHAGTVYSPYKLTAGLHAARMAAHRRFDSRAEPVLIGMTFTVMFPTQRATIATAHGPKLHRLQTVMHRMPAPPTCWRTVASLSTAASTTQPGNGYQLQLTNQGAVYDPVKSTWTALGHPRRWKFIGDSPTSVLPDGQLLDGDKLHEWDAALDPKTLNVERDGSHREVGF